LHTFTSSHNVKSVEKSNISLSVPISYEWVSKKKFFTNGKKVNEEAKK